MVPARGKMASSDRSINMDKPPKYTLKEVEILRKKIIGGRGYSRPFIKVGPLADAKKLYHHLITSPHLYFIKDDFASLPLLIGKCPEQLDEVWYRLVIEWRLEIGK